MKHITLMILMALSLWAIDTVQVLQAQKEAENIYQKTKNVYLAIEILRKADIDEIVENKPEKLTPEQYSLLLYDYAKYLYDTADDTYRHINQRLVQKLLIQAEKYHPDDNAFQLLLARSYLRHFKFAVRTRLGWGVKPGRPYDESWEWTIPLEMKEAYTKYVALCLAKNIPPELSDEEWLIVKRQRLFIEYYSTFSSEQPKYGPSHEQYKPEFENICSEYVAMLNQMPDDENMQCSRYVEEHNVLFKVEPIISGDWRKRINHHLVNYKSEEFIDRYYFLQLKKVKMYEGPYTDQHICFYQYVDFQLTRQERNNNKDDCRRRFDKHYFKNQDINTIK